MRSGCLTLADWVWRNRYYLKIAKGLHFVCMSRIRLRLLCALMGTYPSIKAGLIQLFKKRSSSRHPGGQTQAHFNLFANRMVCVFIKPTMHLATNAAVNPADRSALAYQLEMKLQEPGNTTEMGCIQYISPSSPISHRFHQH